MKRLVIFLSAFLFFSCVKKFEISELSFQEQGDMFHENNFAVINEKYVTSFDIPGNDGIIISHLRYAEVFEIAETRIIKNQNGEQEFWIKIADGWVLSSLVQIYNNFDKAKTASEKLLE